jgi:hypothetical protein
VTGNWTIGNHPHYKGRNSLRDGKPRSGWDKGYTQGQADTCFATNGECARLRARSLDRLWTCESWQRPWWSGYAQGCADTIQMNNTEDVRLGR